MANNQNISEAAEIESRVKLWLNTNQNKFHLDLTKDPIIFEQHSDNQFDTPNDSQLLIGLSFRSVELTKDSSLDQLKSNFMCMQIDRVPLPDLNDISSRWHIYSQTSKASFSNGVTFEDYDSKTQILQLHITTKFFAIYGCLSPEHRTADNSLPQDTFFLIRQYIQGDINLRAKLVFI